jgi:uncharacterized protein
LGDGVILEGLVTTRSPQGAMHLAPMGPRVDAEMRRFLLRPFPTSQTCRNLLAHPEGVLHVTDDALLLARAAIGAADPPPEHRPASAVGGFVLTGACRAYEFRVHAVDDREERVRIDCEVVRAERLRDFFGFNRARHAVVEAAVLATRTHLLDLDEIEAEYRKLAVVVGKTGGPDERAAMDLLTEHLRRVRALRSPA